MLLIKMDDNTVPMARPMPLFAPVTTATRDWDAILDSYDDSSFERKTSCNAMRVFGIVLCNTVGD